MANFTAWIWLGLLFGGVALARHLLRRQRSEGPGGIGSCEQRSGTAPLPDVDYRARRHLLSPTELGFARALRQALPPEIHVCAKVRLADVIQAPSGKNWRTATNRIQSKHLDFVLMDGSSARILAAIELDDRSHQQETRKERDDFVQKALASAAVPLLRVRAAQNYDHQMLIVSLRNVLGTASRAA